MILKVVTPEKQILELEIKQVTVPTKSGLITILPEHENLIAELSLGNLEYISKDNTDGFVTVETGFVKTDGKTIEVLTDHTLSHDEDEKLIEELKANAEKEMKNLPDERGLEKLRSQIRIANLNLQSKRKRAHR